MAYSGLGAGTVGDPYQITTVAQFDEMGSATYAGAYFLLMNDLDFSAKTTFAPAHYAYLDGGNNSITNIPCVGAGFYIYSNSAIRRIKLRYSDSIYYAPGVTTFYGASTVSNVVLDEIEISNNIYSDTRSNSLMSASAAFDTSCTVNNIVVDGSFSTLFTKIYGTISNIKVLNTYQKNCVLVKQMYSTTVVEKFQYVKPITVSDSVETVSMIAGTVPAGAIIRKGFIDFGITNIVANFGAICASIAVSSGVTIQNVYIKGNLNSTAVNGVYAAICSAPSYSTNVIDSIFYWGNMTTPMFTSRTSILAQESRNITKSYYNSDVLTITGKSKPGQTGMTTAQFAISSNFIGWDFSTIWVMGVQHPELIDVPRYNSFVNPMFGLFASMLRVNGLSVNVTAAVNSSVIYGFEFIDESSNIAYSVENSPIFTANFSLTEDQTYKVIGYVVESSVRKNIYQSLYTHYYQDTAVALTNIIASKYTTLNNGTNRANQIHGSCILNGYMYGSTRNYAIGTPTYNGCIYKAPVDNISSYTLIPIFLDAANTKSTEMDSLVAIGTKLFTVAKNKADGYGRMIVFDTLTDDYQVYKINGQSADGYPSCTDGEFIYVYAGSSKIYKINPNVFNSGLKFNNDSFWDIGTIFNTITSHYSSAITPHTLVVDANNVYVGFGSGNYISEYELQKIDKATMLILSYATVPKMTDDMCQTNTHLFIGVELLEPANPNSYGYGWGACAIRKSDMRVTAIPKLHSTDTVSVTSYASLIFGQYLIDLKTNCNIYALNISDVDNWDINENIGLRTLKAYKPYMPDGENPVSRPINEIFLTEAGLFIGFNWAEPSAVTELELTGLNYFVPPTVTTDESAIVEIINASLSATIIATGGKTVTACGIILGNDPDLSDGIKFPMELVTNDILLSFNNLAYGVYYWQAYATNAEGDGVGEIKSFEIAEPTAPGQPTDLANTITINVILSWVAPMDSGGTPIVGYKIERKPVGGAWVVIVANTGNADLTYTDTVEVGNYLYRISTITSYATGLPSAELPVIATIGSVGNYAIYLGSTEIAVM